MRNEFKKLLGIPPTPLASQRSRRSGQWKEALKQKVTARQSRNHKQEDQSQPNDISCTQRTQNSKS